MPKQYKYMLLAARIATALAILAGIVAANWRLFNVDGAVASHASSMSLATYLVYGMVTFEAIGATLLMLASAEGNVIRLVTRSLCAYFLVRLVFEVLTAHIDHLLSPLGISEISRILLLIAALASIEAHNVNRSTRQRLRQVRRGAKTYWKKIPNAKI